MFSALKVALIRRFARKALKKDIAPLDTLATHPDVMIAYAKYNMVLEKTNLVSAKLKKLARFEQPSRWNVRFESTSTPPEAERLGSAMSRSAI